MPLSAFLVFNGWKDTFLCDFLYTKSWSLKFELFEEFLSNMISKVFLRLKRGLGG